MKYLGAAVMPAFLSIYSVIISLRLQKRAEILDKTYLLLTEIKMLLEYSRPPLYELIARMAEKDCYRGLFIFECREEMKEGTDFPVAWTDAVGKRSLYKKEEKEKLIQLGSFLGTCDLESQLTVLQMYMITFDEFRKEARYKKQKYAATTIFVGVFCALGLFVMSL